MPASIPSAAGARVFRASIAARWLSFFATALLGLMSLVFAALAGLMWFQNIGLFLEFGVLTALASGLTIYVGRDLGGKRGLVFAFGDDAVTADLPAGRSRAHRLSREHLVIPYSEIAALETRREGYRSFGMAMIQQPFVLRSRAGATTFLFEERALGSILASHEFADVVAELQARSHAPLRDLGMVEGRAGMFGVWGARAADWSARSLSAGEQARLWKRARYTGLLAIGLALVVLLLILMAPAAWVR